VAPRDGGLDRVAGAPDGHVRDEAQAREMLDRLVRRSVLAEADRVVREHEHALRLHQRRHPERVARVVGEHEEGPAVWNESTVQGKAVHDRGHTELAYSIVQIVAARLFPGDALPARM